MLNKSLNISLVLGLGCGSRSICLICSSSFVLLANLMGSRSHSISFCIGL